MFIKGLGFMLSLSCIISFNTYNFIISGPTKMFNIIIFYNSISMCCLLLVIWLMIWLMIWLIVWLVVWLMILLMVINIVKIMHGMCGGRLIMLEINAKIIAILPDNKPFLIRKPTLMQIKRLGLNKLPNLILYPIFYSRISYLFG
jgi:hypothetical protein